MSNLFVSLRNAAGAMTVFERGMGVVQGNVSNASTPGYAKQTQGLAALTLDLDHGLPGGVRSTGTLDSRNRYAEQAVRQQIQFLGSAEERAQQLARLEGVFQIGENTGLDAALSGFFAAFSALSVAPNDLPARQTALDQAARLADSFVQTSIGIQSAIDSTRQGVEAQVERVNTLIGRLQELNTKFRSDSGAQRDAGFESQLHTLLEELSDAVDFTMLRNDDGSVNIYAGGQTALLLGDHAYALSTATEPGKVQIFDAQGKDITEQLRGGRLGGLIELSNNVLPGYMADLDRLAETFANSVNATLAAGVDLNGQPPTQNLFVFDAAAGSARSLRTNDLAPAELALAAPGAPGGNANALAVAALEQSKVIDGQTFAHFYGGIAGRAGRDLVSARDTAQLQRMLVAQARELRDEYSRVNLDEEALILMEFQRAYQASAQLIKTIDEMLDTVMSVLR